MNRKTWHWRPPSEGTGWCWMRWKPRYARHWFTEVVWFSGQCDNQIRTRRNAWEPIANFRRE